MKASELASKGLRLVHSLWQTIETAVAECLRRCVPKRFPIAYKLALAITLLISTGMLLLGVVIISNQTQLLQQQNDAFGYTIARQMAENVKEPVMASDELVLAVLTNSLMSNENVLGTAIYSETGEVFVAAGAVPPEASLARLSAWQEPWSWEQPGIIGGQAELVSFISPVRFQDVLAGYVLVTFNRTVMSRAIKDSVQAIMVATVLMILLGVVVAFVMSKRLSRPIEELISASRAIRDGEFRYPFKERRNDELGSLTDALSGMAAGLLEKKQVEQAFSRYVSPNVAQEIMSHLDHVELGGKHVKATVLFADIVGFTSISEKLTPNEVAGLLNEYFSHIAKATEFYRGTVDKFMGDCAMLVFGVPAEDEEHCFHAVACAVMIQRIAARLNAERSKRGLFPIQFRMGINTGEVLAGNMGSREHMQYTVVGDSVNLAARLYAIADPGAIVIGDDVYLDPNVQSRVLMRRYKSMRLRGKSQPVDTHVVKDLATSYRKAMEARIDEILSEHAAA